MGHHNHPVMPVVLILRPGQAAGILGLKPMEKTRRWFLSIIVALIKHVKRPFVPGGRLQLEQQLLQKNV